MLGNSEYNKLIDERNELGNTIGICGVPKPVVNYEQTDQFKRIAEIDERLREILFARTRLAY